MADAPSSSNPLVGSRFDPILSGWISEARSAIDLSETEIRERYSGAGTAHFERVAKAALDLFGDEHLARAAFLHGVPSKDMPPLIATAAGTQAVAILKARAVLRSLADIGPRLPARLLGSVLPNLRDHRGAALLVLEQLDHFDPEGTVAAWTNDFYERVPSALPQYEIPSLDEIALAHASSRSAFLRFVVEPTAHYLGMHNQGRLAANVDVLYRDVSRFSGLHSLVSSYARPGGERDELLHTFQPLFKEVRWEWASLGRLDRSLPSRLDVGGQDFPASGSILIVVERDDLAFTSLRKLHKAFQHDWKHLKDNLGGTRRGAPVALSSMVRVPQFEKSIRVEIVTKISVTKRRQAPVLSKGRVSTSVQLTRAVGTGAREITVFAPDGLHRLLPEGATVLNFAYAVHNDLVILTRRARVNRELVELSRPLADGDVVWLELADTPRLLPKNWREMVAPETIPKISKKYKQAMRPHLVEDGKLVIQRTLALAGSVAEDSKVDIDRICDQIGRRLVDDRRVAPASRKIDLSADWWYLHLALLERNDSEEDLPFRPALSPEGGKLLLSGILTAILGQARVDLGVLSIPDAERTLLSQARLCLECRPILVGSLLGERIESTLILHRPGTNCSLGTRPFLVKGPPSNEHIYLLRTVNRTGLAADVLRVFAEMGAEVVDVSAARVGGREGLFRVQLEHVTPEARDALNVRLGQLHGVLEVKTLGAGLEPEERLGGPLPPRRNTRTLDEGIVSPFFVGDKIVADGYFYGMRDQKSTLAQLLRDVSGKSHTTTVWIRGPKKVGKSSLSLSFLRASAAQVGGTAEYIEAERCETWCSFAQRFTMRLNRYGLPPRDTVQDALRARLDSVGAPIVVVIDEAVNLLMNTVKAGELNQLVQFRDELRSCGGVLLVWVGPAANVESLPSAAKHLLQSALPMNVPPLTLDEIEGMLRCEQIQLPCPLTLESGLARNVQTITGGNPFWVAHLGSAMWEIRRKQRVELVHFDLQVLREAQRVLCSDEIPFHDRLGSEHWTHATNGHARRILNLLASRPEGSYRAHRMTAMSASQIAAELEDVTITSVVRILEELQVRGSVAFTTSGGGTWQLSAPLLADVLNPPSWFDDQRV